LFHASRRGAHAPTGSHRGHAQRGGVAAVGSSGDEVSQHRWREHGEMEAHPPGKISESGAHRVDGATTKGRFQPAQWRALVVVGGGGSHLQLQGREKGVRHLEIKEGRQGLPSRELTERG
jgi:hypothetical protein